MAERFPFNPGRESVFDRVRPLQQAHGRGSMQSAGARVGHDAESAIRYPALLAGTCAACPNHGRSPAARLPVEDALCHRAGPRFPIECANLAVPPGKKNPKPPPPPPLEPNQARTSPRSSLSRPPDWVMPLPQAPPKIRWKTFWRKRLVEMSRLNLGCGRLHSQTGELARRSLVPHTLCCCRSAALLCRVPALFNFQSFNRVTNANSGWYRAPVVFGEQRDARQARRQERLP